MAHFIYVSCADAGCVQTFRLADGEAAPELVHTLALGGRPMPMCVDEARGLIYVALRAAPWALCALRRDARSGQLSLAGSAPLPASMAYLSRSPCGRFILGAAYAEGVLAVSPLDAAGLPGAPCCVLPVGHGAHQISLAADGCTAYASVLGEDRLACLHLDCATGQLVERESVRLPPGSGPRHFALHSAASALYVIGELDGQIYRVDTGPGHGVRRVGDVCAALQPGQRPAAADLLLSADARRLYASERSSHRLFAFAVEPGAGDLQPLGHWPAEAGPRACALSAEHVFVAGQGSHRLGVFRREAGGQTLRAAAGCATGEAPSWVCVLAAG